MTHFRVSPRARWLRLERTLQAETAEGCGLPNARNWMSMIGVGFAGLIAGALQLIVPSYAFRLVRRFGTSRVGWFIVTAFALLALMHLLAAFESGGSGRGFDLTQDLLYVVGSVLLLVGMGHMEALFAERERAQTTQNQLNRTWESQLKEQTADLISNRDALLQELARRDEIIMAVQESEARYRFLFDQSPLAMWIMDLRSCRFLTVNHAALRQYGFTADEFKALTGRDLLLPSAFARFLQDTANPCAGVETRGTWQHCKKDGTILEVEITALDMNFAGLPARLILAADLSQRKRGEAKSRKTQRMEIVGQIAGGVAHHFNGILLGIQARTATLLEQPLDTHSIAELEKISAAVTRGASLTRQLLAAGGRQLIRTEAVDLNGLIRTFSQVIRRVLGDRITLEHIPESHLPPILADRHLIEQAVLSMALNAREAMPEGGTLTFTTEKVHLEPGKLEPDTAAAAGDFIRLRVRDTGLGMSAEVKSRIFEPFFTTREPGCGIGLGLASVHGIVGQHGGWVEFTSEPGEGTEFRVCLPCIPNSFSVPAAPQPGTLLVRGTILVIEPDDRRRALARFVLNRHGYYVIEADNSATASVLWVGQGPTVDLLITDLSMTGGASGRELAEQFRQTRPGLKVIYGGQELASPGEQAVAETEGAGFIAKPYTPESLLRAVQETLGKGK